MGSYKDKMEPVSLQLRDHGCTLTANWSGNVITEAKGPQTHVGSQFSSYMSVFFRIIFENCSTYQPVYSLTRRTEIA